jgi:hypothetical protein
MVFKHPTAHEMVNNAFFRLLLEDANFTLRIDVTGADVARRSPSS